MTDIRFANHVDLQNNELRNVTLQIRSTDPNPGEARIYYNSTLKAIKYHDGTEWKVVGDKDLNALAGRGLEVVDSDTIQVSYGLLSGAGVFGQANNSGSASTAARSDHKHSLPAHDAAAHVTIKLSDLAAPATDLDINNKTLNNVKAVDFTQTKVNSGTMSIAVATPVQFDSFSSTTYRSAEYLLQFSQLSSYSQTKVLVIHNGTDVGISEYAHVSIGNDISYEIDAAFALGNLELTIACPDAVQSPISVKFSRILFDV